jgi:hypothetical protein
MDRGISKFQQQQMHNPFTNKVLGPQRSPPPQDPSRKQFDDAADLLDSVIDELKPAKRSPPTQTQKQQNFRQQQFSQRPSGVNAMQKKFEQKQASQVAPSSQRIVPLRRGSSTRESEAQYSEIGEFQQREETVSAIRRCSFFSKLFHIFQVFNFVI